MKDIIKWISDRNDLRPNRGAQHIKKEQDVLKNEQIGKRMKCLEMKNMVLKIKNSVV